MTAQSIHIGINTVNPDHYQGWDGQLRGCENDARDLLSIAKDGGYSSSVFLTSSATADRVLGALASAAGALESNDTLLVTYSGHGGQVPDTNDDESDKYDETWALFDRMLIDDELYTAWSKFKPGVRILVLSDSCHSGTVLKQAIYPMNSTDALRLLDSFPIDEYSIPRIIPFNVQDSTYRSHASEYRSIQIKNPKGERSEIEASVILISGCQDNQTSADGLRNGLFTSTLLAVWDRGSFAGDHPSFHKLISSKMPPLQTPNYSKVGVKNEAFENERPFFA